ncbi:hypothetical protein GGI04_005099, partial [Coemansia thaxteri]
MDKSIFNAQINRFRSAPLAVVATACTALMVNNITYAVSFACLPHIFEDMNLASEAELGIATTMFGLGSVLTSIVSGMISDYKSSRKLPLL